MEQLPCESDFRDSDRCELYRKIGHCFMDTHHLFHPRRDYRKEGEREFRNLEENKVYICRNLHQLEHAIFEPPDKPDLELMKLAVEEERNRRRGDTNGNQ